MRSLYRKHPVAMGVLTLALALMVFFAMRLTFAAVYWSQHRHEAVEGWMTVRYVARSWEVDPRAILALTGFDLTGLDQTGLDQTGLPPAQGKPVTLEDIAASQGLPVAEVIARVEAAVAKLAAGQTAGGGGP